MSPALCRYSTYDKCCNQDAKHRHFLLLLQHIKSTDAVWQLLHSSVVDKSCNKPSPWGLVYPCAVTAPMTSAATKMWNIAIFCFCCCHCNTSNVLMLYDNCCTLVLLTKAATNPHREDYEPLVPLQHLRQVHATKMRNIAIFCFCCNTSKVLMLYHSCVVLYLRYLGKYRDTKRGDTEVTVYRGAGIPWKIPQVSWDDNTVQLEPLYCWQRLHTAMRK